MRSGDRPAASSRGVGEAAVVAFRSAAEFATWLDEHAGLRAGVWLKLAKQGSGVPSMTSDEAVDVGLCFGWICGPRKPLDEVHYLQKYVPRRRRSRWSQINVAKVEALLAAGRMRPSGMAEVEAARADGRWAAADASQRDATVPPDLAAALAASPRAGQTFAGLGKTRRYAVIHRLVTARTAQARQLQLRRAMAALEQSPGPATVGAPELRGPVLGDMRGACDRRGARAPA
ncbi:Uncharacterized conserved protein YdeI, YjbR/CyaY-like superfamily, DUF1801 family [Nannocystis exedens]|uniref:Uncharacterized conserved protein YdeI, YjbR/CyaY-like superfamily, DUF1801 family n=1 Tax=Nannocystis exedens TaxID=54 RepID=A0A1I1UYY4_9BACT|nr:YdeI/OmpD-associated family protein [Nannocystis exedens]PCC72204.1 hypothetical protein NAEX_05283 [Nannocystis exedens]SFD75894.1 Uncharacterized conserved protein YdeI, YjbR/CyaY-like superfamily, DUF1801 family [Nannocystis exedens]